jgi:hypothetical protein
VLPSDVLVHGRGGLGEVFEVLQDVEDTLNREAASSAQTSRKFDSTNEFKGLVERVRRGEATVVLRKLFLWSGQGSVMQEIWIQDKRNPDGWTDPFKSYVVVHVHHHWETRVARSADIKPEHLEIVDAVNARHICNSGRGYKGDNPFFNTYIERGGRGGAGTLKVFPLDEWRCPKCGLENFQNRPDCRGRGTPCAGARPSTSWKWKSESAHDADLALILAEADKTLQWPSESGKSEHRGAGDTTPQVHADRLDSLESQYRTRRPRRDLATRQLAMGSSPNWAALPAPVPPAPPYCILFAGANNANEVQLNLENEVRQIQDAFIQRHGYSSWRDKVIFKHSFYSSTADLSRDLRILDPACLQFSCHGYTSALALFRQDLAAQDLVNFIASWCASGKRLQLIIVNACDSAEIVHALSEHVDFVIGHITHVADADAVNFARELYGNLGAGESLELSFNAAKMVSNPYCLLGRKNARMFHLLAPGVSETVSVVAGSSILMPDTVTVDSDCNELVCFLKGKGLSAIAARFSEVMGMELVEDLGRVQSEDLEGPDFSFLRRWHKEKLIELVQRITAASVSLRDSGLDDNFLSSADTASEGGDTASESGDDTDFIFDATLAKHPGNPEDFQECMKGFITDLLEVMSLGAPDGATEVFSLPLGGRTHEWSYCMLVWMRFAKDAYFDSIWRGKWQECITCPSQDKLLALLDKCLEQERTKHRRWARAGFKRLECNKPFTAAIFVTDVMVRHSLGGHPKSELLWQQDVVKNWFANGEGASAFLFRANKFLRENVINGISVVTQVVETQSYVAFMRMTKLSSLLLFEYLDTRKLEDTAVFGAKGGMGSLFHGFCMFVSSSRRVFSLAPADVPALGARATVLQGLRCLARLSAQAWELLGPIKTAREYVEDTEDPTEKEVSTQSLQTQQQMNAQRRLHKVLFDIETLLDAHTDTKNDVLYTIIEDWFYSTSPIKEAERTWIMNEILPRLQAVTAPRPAGNIKQIVIHETIKWAENGATGKSFVSWFSATTATSTSDVSPEQLQDKRVSVLQILDPHNQMHILQGEGGEESKVELTQSQHGGLTRAQKIGGEVRGGSGGLDVCGDGWRSIRDAAGDAGMHRLAHEDDAVSQASTSSQSSSLSGAGHLQARAIILYCGVFGELLKANADGQALDAAFQGHVDQSSGTSVVGPGLPLSSWPPMMPFLHAAARMGCAAIVERLICHYGCDINARQKKDEGTALHLAAYYGHGDVVELLLKHGSDRTATNKYKETALESAKSGQQAFGRGKFEFPKLSPSGANDSALLKFHRQDPLKNSYLETFDFRTRDPNGWPSWDAVIRLLTTESHDGGGGIEMGDITRRLDNVRLQGGGGQRLQGPGGQRGGLDERRGGRGGGGRGGNSCEANPPFCSPVSIQIDVRADRACEGADFPGWQTAVEGETAAAAAALELWCVK